MSDPNKEGQGKQMQWAKDAQVQQDAQQNKANTLGQNTQGQNKTSTIG